MNRRDFLTTSAGFAALLASPEAVQAATAQLAAGDAWTLAVQDLEADVPRRPMRLVQGRPEQALLVSRAFVAIFGSGSLDLEGRFIVLDPSGAVRSLPLGSDDA